MALDTRHLAFLTRFGRPCVYLTQQKSHAAETRGSYYADNHWNVRRGLTLQVSPKGDYVASYYICGYSSTTI